MKLWAVLLAALALTACGKAGQPAATSPEQVAKALLESKLSSGNTGCASLTEFIADPAKPVEQATVMGFELLSFRYLAQATFAQDCYLDDFALGGCVLGLNFVRNPKPEGKPGVITNYGKLYKAGEVAKLKGNVRLQKGEAGWMCSTVN